MTRKEYEKHIDALSLHLTYPELDHLHAINDHDAGQRAEIEKWKAAAEQQNGWYEPMQREIARLQDDLDLAERALISKWYRRECGIPACNCGPQWVHGGHAEERLREISEEIPNINGETILGRVKRQNQEIIRLREALQELMDVQNGPPLEKYRREWDCAMSKAESILKETP